LLNKITNFYRTHEQIDRSIHGTIRKLNEDIERYSFKAIEKLFKVISWLIYLSLIMYLSNKTNSKGMILLSLFLKDLVYSYITFWLFINIQKILCFFLPKRESFSMLVAAISSFICLKYIFVFVNSEFSHFMKILLRKFS